MKINNKTSDKIALTAKDLKTGDIFLDLKDFDVNTPLMVVDIWGDPIDREEVDIGMHRVAVNLKNGEIYIYTIDEAVIKVEAEVNILKRLSD